MTNIDKCVAELKMLNASLMALNDQLEATLYDTRHSNGLCVTCGKPVDEVGDEYCDKCYQEGMKAVLDDTTHPDQK